MPVQVTAENAVAILNAAVAGEVLPAGKVPDEITDKIRYAHQIATSAQEAWERGTKTDLVIEILTMAGAPPEGTVKIPPPPPEPEVEPEPEKTDNEDETDDDPADEEEYDDRISEEDEDGLVVEQPQPEPEPEPEPKKRRTRKKPEPEHEPVDGPVAEVATEDTPEPEVIHEDDPPSATDPVHRKRWKKTEVTARPTPEVEDWADERKIFAVPEPEDMAPSMPYDWTTCTDLEIRRMYSAWSSHYAWLASIAAQVEGEHVIAEAAVKESEAKAASELDTDPETGKRRSATALNAAIEHDEEVAAARYKAAVIRARKMRAQAARETALKLCEHLSREMSYRQYEMEKATR